MNNGKNCPACRKDIGLWPVLLAAWPTRIRCPHCKARLSYGPSILLVVALIAFLLGLFYLVGLKYRLSQLEFHVIYVGLVVAILLPLDVAASLYLRQKGRLRKADS